MLEVKYITNKVRSRERSEPRSEQMLAADRKKRHGFLRREKAAKTAPLLRQLKQALGQQ